MIAILVCISFFLGMVLVAFKVLVDLFGFCGLGIHEWTKWEMTYPSLSCTMQHRECCSCGKRQTRFSHLSS